MSEETRGAAPRRVVPGVVHESGCPLCAEPNRPQGTAGDATINAVAADIEPLFIEKYAVRAFQRREITGQEDLDAWTPNVGERAQARADAELIARRLAEAGWLKDPADDEYQRGYDAGHADGYNDGRTDRLAPDLVLTPTDQAVLDAAHRVCMIRSTATSHELHLALDGLEHAMRAVGGSVPADPKEQP